MGKLAIQPSAWLREGAIVGENSTEAVYSVNGLPHGEFAQIAKRPDGKWQIRRSSQRGTIEESGAYSDPDAALEALEAIYGA